MSARAVSLRPLPPPSIQLVDPTKHAEAFCCYAGIRPPSEASCSKPCLDSMFAPLNPELSGTSMGFPQLRLRGVVFDVTGSLNVSVLGAVIPPLAVVERQYHTAHRFCWHGASATYIIRGLATLPVCAIASARRVLVPLRLASGHRLFVFCRIVSHWVGATAHCLSVLTQHDRLMSSTCALVPMSPQLTLTTSYQAGSQIHLLTATVPRLPSAPIAPGSYETIT